MTLVNISNKIINLGSDPILPNETRPITKATAELPSIKAFVERRLVQIVDEGRATAAASNKKSAAKEDAPSDSIPATPDGSTANGIFGDDSGKSSSAADGKKTSQAKK